MRKLVHVTIVVLLHAVLCSAAQGETRFEISYDKTVHSGAITGRVILVITRRETPEPRLQIGPNTTPMFGIDVKGLQPGQAGVIDQATFGHPGKNWTTLGPKLAGKLHFIAGEMDNSIESGGLSI